MKKRSRWIQDEYDILIANYLSSSREEMESLLPGRPWKVIRRKALDRGMQRRELSFSLRRNGDMSPLLSDSLEAHYWLGFLTADGHFADNGLITVAVRDVDREHMDKFASFVGGSVKTYGRNVSVGAHHPSVRSAICERFGFTSRKTYDCPVLPPMTDDQFISYLAGLIDGDGHIEYGRGATIRIKLHGNQMPFLEQVAERFVSAIGLRKPSVWLNGQRRAVIDIMGFDTLGTLKARLEQLGVPLLTRKWGKIDVARVGQYRRRQDNVQIAHSLRSEGLLQREIAERMGVNLTTVWRYLQILPSST